MGTTDTNLIKEKIINFLNKNGPSLPIHIAKEINMDMIFASAFLSELVFNKKIKTSHMRVGTSLIYFLPGQEEKLEKFSEYLKGKEHEAMILLKKKRFLINSQQEISIQVALKSITDFAKSFERNGEIIWRYFLVKEDDYLEEKKTGVKQKEESSSKEKEVEVKQKEKNSEKEKKKFNLNKKTKSRKITKTKDEKFFSKVKEDLIKKGFEISDIISFNKKELILEVKKDEKRSLVFAHKKKRIDEKDILNAYKNSKEKQLTFSIFSLGESTKKIQNLIDSIKNLDALEKIGE